MNVQTHTALHKPTQGIRVTLHVQCCNALYMHAFDLASAWQLSAARQVLQVHPWMQC